MLRAGCNFEAKHGRRVEIGEEDQDVVLLMVPPEMVDEPGTPGSLLLQPLHFVGAAVRVVENPVRVAC